MTEPEPRKAAGGKEFSSKHPAAKRRLIEEEHEAELARATDTPAASTSSDTKKNVPKYKPKPKTWEQMQAEIKAKTVAAETEREGAIGKA